MKGVIDSPLGPLTLVVQDGAVVALDWGDFAPPAPKDGLLGQAAAELARYFATGRLAVSVPLRAGETDFQRRFAVALCAIPDGETRSYGDLAAELGVSAQAIGQACGANPIPILVPCHRVLGAQGLGGYSGHGGVEAKVWLLRHEGAAGLLI